jgi:uncharacterized CHY-type Zn-finger protein
MWFIIGGGKETRRIEGGKRLNMRCENCQKLATFYECRVKKSVNAFFFVELWDKTVKAMQCGECLALFQEEEVSDAESNAERAKREATELRKVAERQQQTIDQLAEEAKKADKAKKQQSKDLDKALAELKKKMGK